MNTTDPLANLRDIHLPDPISWWPPAPGWWLLLLLIVAAVCYLGAMAIKRYNRRLYRRQAMAELRQIEQLPCQPKVIATFEILRRTAISAYPREPLTNLGINEFISFLDTQHRSLILLDNSNCIESFLYADQTPSQELTEAIFNSAKVWVQRHPDKIDQEPSAC